MKYICEGCNIKVLEDEALLNDFTCPKCDEVYEKESEDEEIIGNICDTEKNLKKICPKCKGGKMRTRKYCSLCWKEIRQERKKEGRERKEDEDALKITIDDVEIK